MPDKKISVLHGALEYKKRVGGVGSVTVGLTPALIRKGFNVSVVTPYYDAYLEDAKYKDLQPLTTVTHIYKGQQFKSDIFRVCAEVVNGQPLYHYLIKPVKNSSVAWLFNIERDEANIYRSFPWSEAHNRREYFNSAVAAMLRMPDDKLPKVDIYHAHTWHAGLAGVIAEEMENSPQWQAIYRTIDKPLKKNPYKISTIHMLLAREHGQLSTKKSVSAFLESVGLPADLPKKFSEWKQYINPGHVKQVVLALLYSDHVTTVSEGLAHEAAHVKGGGQGLDELFNWLDQQQRFEGILNGITHAKYDATSKKNLQDFAFNPQAITAYKYRVKVHLASLYPQLDPKKMWFLFIDRFAQEKGMDKLEDALAAITKENAIFIIMGKHVVTPKLVNGKQEHFYQELIDKLRQHPNVLVIDDPAEQDKVGTLIRAAADCYTKLGNNESAGLGQIELFATGTFAIAPAIQGLPDSVKDLDTHPETGSGFLYNNDANTSIANMQTAIAKAANFYREQRANLTLNATLQRIWQYSKQFDWDATAAKRYTHMYNKVLSRPQLSYERVRTVFKPMLSMLSVYKQSDKNNAQYKSMTKIIAKRMHNDSQYRDLNTDKVIHGKIFQIGFNKSGTTFFYHGFVGSNIPSLHYGIRENTIAATIFENYMHGRKLLTGIDEFMAYFDMEDIYHPTMPLYIAQSFFKELDKQYPGSKFILNTRDKDNWLRSRFAHLDPMNGKSYADELCDRYQCTPEELYARWSKEWDDHHQAIREHFKDRPNDLLEYNIEKDPPEKICDFFEYLNLDVTKFQHANRTVDRGLTGAQPRSKPIFAH